MTVVDADMTIIKELVNEIKEAGTYKVEFDASSFSRGSYFYRFESKGFNKTKEMILIE
jgi:hypothetical protein